MAVAFTQKAVRFTKARCDTSAHLRADLDTILLSVGWTHVRSVTNGFVYALMSPPPQSLSAKCLIQDQGKTFGVQNYPVIQIQMMSFTHEVAGASHPIIYGVSQLSAIGYQVLAGCCQLWISLPGYTASAPATGATAHNMACGIPSLPPDVATECSADLSTKPPITDLWWSGGGSIDGFRNGRFCVIGYSFSINEVVTLPPPTNQDAYSGSLRIFPVTGTENTDYSAHIDPRTIKYNPAGPNTGNPIFFDALIGWNYQIQGQIWDAFVMSRDMPMDATYISTELDTNGKPYTAKWINYMGDTMSNSTFGGGSSWFASLYLLVASPPGGAGNVAY
jgi:hypothetical protein